MDNVIDASERFRDGNGTRQRLTPIDRLRKSTRVPRGDAILIARRLGELAETIEPGKAGKVAKRWFDLLWHGERWAKRKRFVLLAGEAPGDAMASSGADWAALVEQAAKDVHPADSDTASKERARVCRDLIRGTVFLQTEYSGPLRADTAQTLLSTLATNICQAILDRTELLQLWDVLEDTPFDIEFIDQDRPILTPEQAADPVMAAILTSRGYEGDPYSLGPLGEASRLAADLPKYNHPRANPSSVRFEPTEQRDSSWQFPMIGLGVFAKRVNARIFVVPDDFPRELPSEHEFHRADEDWFSKDELVFDWLVHKGIISGERYRSLPDLEYSSELGYGWKPISFDSAASVYLEVRQKSDGTPGVWFSCSPSDFPHLYPILPSMDTIPLAAKRSPLWLDFLPCGVSGLFYELFEWPDYIDDFLIGGQPPQGACMGLIDVESAELPLVEGWIDDRENIEVQEFLFRLQSSTRFCPSVAVDNILPPPCALGSVAAAIISNAGVDPADRIANMLLKQAEAMSSNGLAFHAALLGAHRERIKNMIVD